MVDVGLPVVRVGVRVCGQVVDVCVVGGGVRVGGEVVGVSRWAKSMGLFLVPDLSLAFTDLPKKLVNGTVNPSLPYIGCSDFTAYALA